MCYGKLQCLAIKTGRPHVRRTKRAPLTTGLSSFMPEPIIRAEALTKIVRSGDDPLTILDGVTFAVDAGRFHRDRRRVRLGQDDAPRTAGRARPADIGEVHIDGAALSGLDEDAAAPRCASVFSGFVFQSFQLLPALTALENVMLPLELAGCCRRAGARA